MHLLPVLATLAGVSAVSAALDVGYWDVNITDSRGAQGDEARYTYAIHSSKPERTILDQYTYRYDGNTSTFSNDNTFSLDIKSACAVGLWTVAIKQRVIIGPSAYWVVGSGNVTVKINTVTGRGYSVSFRLNSTLDDTAVDSCGRPLNYASG